MSCANLCQSYPSIKQTLFSNWKDVNVTSDVTYYANYQSYPILIDLLSKGMQYDPKQRWSAQQLCNHPLLASKIDLLSMKPTTMNTNGTDTTPTSTQMNTLTVPNEHVYSHFDCVDAAIGSEKLGDKIGSRARVSIRRSHLIIS